MTLKFSLLLFLACSSLCSAASQVAVTVPPLCVTATFLGEPVYSQQTQADGTILRSMVRSPITYEPMGRQFPILLCVTNVSPIPQSFVTMSCSWEDSWTARVVGRPSDDKVYIGEYGACAANAPQTITLKPGESYQKQTIVCMITESKAHRLRFQAGLELSPRQKQDVVWSNALSVIVKPWGT